MMDKNRLAHHVALCRRNLRSPRVKCCAGCPFEAEIVAEYPELAALFKAKREALAEPVHRR
jgi:hypothetical protein